MNLVVDNLHVSGLDEGSGKAALLLHGWGNDHDTFEGVASQLKGYRVIAPDLPGFGTSQPPPEAWGAEEYARFVVELLDKLEVKKVDLLIGHSFGGRIAVVLAGDKLVSIGKLVLLASHGLPEPKTAKGMGVGLLARFGRAAPASIRRPIGARLASADYRAATGVMQEVFKKVISQDATRQAKLIACPTLLIYGSKDTTTPPELARRFQNLIPGSKLSILADAGHHVHQDQPAQTLKLIKDFI